MQNRVLNSNSASVDVQVTGFIMGRRDDGSEFDIARAVEPGNCPHGFWCGPIGDVPADFRGEISGSTSIYYQGIQVGGSSFGPTRLECGEPDIAWNFEWDTDVDACGSVQNRVHNLNSVEVQVTGSITAKSDDGNEFDIAVAVGPGNCPPGGWCGPIGDVPSNFVGEIRGTTSVHYQGSQVGSKSFGPNRLDCSD